MKTFSAFQEILALAQLPVYYDAVFLIVDSGPVRTALRDAITYMSLLSWAHLVKWDLALMAFKLNLVLGRY